MAYSYDELQGEPRAAHEGSQSISGSEQKMAGDVIQINPAQWSPASRIINQRQSDSNYKYGLTVPNTNNVVKIK